MIEGPTASHPDETHLLDNLCFYDRCDLHRRTTRPMELLGCSRLQLFRCSRDECKAEVAAVSVLSFHR